MGAQCPLEGVTYMIEMWLSYFEAHNDLYYVAINRCSGETVSFPNPIDL